MEPMADVFAVRGRDREPMPDSALFAVRRCPFRALGCPPLHPAIPTAAHVAAPSMGNRDGGR